MDQARMLSELAELELDLACKLRQTLLLTDDPRAREKLSIAVERSARSVRRSVALAADLRREAESLPAGPRRRPAPRLAADLSVPADATRH